jgi:hypothetical protein
LPLPSVTPASTQTLASNASSIPKALSVSTSTVWRESNRRNSRIVMGRIVTRRFSGLVREDSITRLPKPRFQRPHSRRFCPSCLVLVCNVEQLLSGVRVQRRDGNAFHGKEGALIVVEILELLFCRIRRERGEWVEVGLWRESFVPTAGKIRRGI